MCPGQPSQCHSTTWSGYQIYDEVGHSYNVPISSFHRGDLYVVVEFCENGNLKDYIEARKTYFTNELIYLETNEDGTPKKTQYAVCRFPIIA